MADSATRGDAIRILSASVEVEHLHAVGTIHGVAVRQVAAACGEGVGRLTSEGDGFRLRWQAPGSSTPGRAVVVTDGGEFLLLDGDDSAAWLRVEVYPDHVLPSPQAGEVHLTATYHNAIGGDNVSAAEASAGDVETWSVTLRNDSLTTVTDVTVWLDAATTGIEISDDGSTWVSPTSEAGGLDLGDLASTATTTLYFRRTISPSASADPAVETLLHYSFYGT